MSNTINHPGQDLLEPTLPGPGRNDAIGRPGGGLGIGIGIGIGNDLPTKPVEPNPAGEPDPTRPGPAVPGIPGNI